MPAAPHNGDGIYLRSHEQRIAAERLTFVLESMDVRWQSFLSIILTGVQYQCEGRSLTLEQLGELLSRCKCANQRRGVTIGYAKGAFVRIDEAYAAWEIERRRRNRERERRRSEEMAAKAEVALTQVQTEWAAERERAEANSRSLLLQEYDREVLGKRAPRPQAKRESP